MKFHHFLLLLLASCVILAVKPQEILAKENISVPPQRISSEDVSSPTESVLPLQKKLVPRLPFSKAWKLAKFKAFSGGYYGAVAGGIQVLSLMWLRTIINYQYRYGSSLKESFWALYAEGGVRRFYKGLSYALIQNPLAKFGSAAANEASKVLVDQSHSFAPVYTSFLASVFSILWRVFIVPFETCKTVLQVDGNLGFKKLLNQLKEGKLFVLYEGSAATILSTFLSHYPWFLVFHWLNRILPVAMGSFSIAMRHGAIGFLATTVADTLSNVVRIVKTVKQTVGATEQAGITYRTIVIQLYKNGGVASLFGRGLLTRIFANGLQNFIFSVVWKLLPLYHERNSRKRGTNLELENEEIREAEVN
jgi:hypothetical protein